MKSKNKLCRYFAIALIGALTFLTFEIVWSFSIDQKQITIQSIEQLSSQDREIINEIANTTGVKTGEILKLKTSINTWNDVLSELKFQLEEGNLNVQTEKTSLLAESGLDAGFLNQLHSEGFDDNKITEANSLVERVITELNQILYDYDQVRQHLQEIDKDIPDQQDLSAFKVLAGRIDLKTAIELLLNLENDFGSMEKVLDEYLLSLQIGLDLNDYLTDPKAYEKTKSELSVKYDMTKIITMTTIEAKVLELLNNENTSTNNNFQQKDTTKPIEPNNMVEERQDEIPTSPLPDIQSTKPLNPQADLMKEINDLKNKSLNN